MAVDEGKYLPFALGEKLQFIRRSRRIRTVAHM